MEILPDLSICVIARKGEETIVGFLDSLYATPGYADLQVVVVLADSVLAGELGEKFPEAILYEEKDISAPDAVLYNRAMRFATGRYLAVAGEDVLCSPAAMERLLEFMEDEPDIGVIGPKLLLPSGAVVDSVRHFLSFPALVLLDCLPWDWPLANFVRRRQFLTDWDRDSSREVEWLSSLFLVFRREVLDEIGSLDERFVCRFGDLDYCHRARRAGWHNYFLHDAEVFLVNSPEQDVAVRWQVAVDGLRFLLRKWRALLA